MHRVNRMCDNDVNHELVPGKPIAVEAIADVPLGIKLSVRGMEVPCKINVKYIEGDKLNIYASLKHKNPSIDKNEFSKKGRPTFIIINNSKADKFENGPIREDMS